MKKQPLKVTNPYLRDKINRKKLIRRAVRTSSGVEGIHMKAKEKFLELQQRLDKALKGVYLTVSQYPNRKQRRNILPLSGQTNKPCKKLSKNDSSEQK